MRKIICLLALTLFVAANIAVAADGEGLFKASCTGCHGVDGSKAAGGSAPLKGRSSDDLLKKLMGYSDGTYGGKQKHVMENIAKKLTADDLKQVAEYASKL